MDIETSETNSQDAAMLNVKPSLSSCNLSDDLAISSYKLRDETTPKSSISDRGDTPQQHPIQKDDPGILQATPGVGRGKRIPANARDKNGNPVSKVSFLNLTCYINGS